MNKKTLILVVTALIWLTTIQPVFAQSDYAYLIEISDTSFLPSTIYAGDVVSLVVDIKDRGNYISIQDLNAVLDTGNQFEPVDLQDTMGLIKPGSTKTLVFKFRVKDNTLPGYYPVFLTMEYTRNDSKVKETQSILVPVSKTEKNIDVTINPRVINPGNQTEVIFTLKNVGGTPVSNISFSWEEGNDLVLPVGSDNKRYVPILQSNQQAEISYTVAADPNIATGIYPLDITLSFIDVNGTRSQTSQVGLIIGGTTDFEVSAEMLNSGQLSISIANIGSNNAGAVVVKIPKQQGIMVSGSEIAVLGNLNKGDFTLANFQVQQTSVDQNNLSQSKGELKNSEMQQNQIEKRSSFPKNSNELVIEIDYTDTTGERQQFQKPVQLSVSTLGSDVTSKAFGLKGLKQSDNSSSWLPWVLILLLVGGAIAFNKFKAKKEWKKLGKVIAIILVIFFGGTFLLESNTVSMAVATIISTILLVWFFRKDLVLSLVEKIKTHKTER